MLSIVKNLLRRAWNFLKKVFVVVLSFLKNIMEFFLSRINKILQKRPNVVPISMKIKEDLEAGNYNTVSMSGTYVVNTFYDSEKEEILEDQSEIVSYEKLDEATKNNFGNKDMIVLNY